MKVIAALVFFGGLAAAAPAQLTVTGSAGAGWQAFPGTLNNYSVANRPYWNQDSKDSGNRNIGNYLNGTYSGSLPAGSAPSPNITPVWWGLPSVTDYLATMDNALGFNFSGLGVGATLRLEVAGFRDSNEIGWYNRADAVGGETLNPIFPGPISPVGTATFTPSASFGLYLKSSGGRVFFSDSARNRGGAAVDKATQHFAVFGASLVPGREQYYVGAEDLFRSEAGVEIVGDYNDVVFTLGVNAIPGPGAAVLAAAGGLLAGRRRR